MVSGTGTDAIRRTPWNRNEKLHMHMTESPGLGWNPASDSEAGGTFILEGERHTEEDTSESPELEKDQMWYLLRSSVIYPGTRKLSQLCNF